MSFPECYDIDWRHKLDIHDRGVLKPILEAALDAAGDHLVACIRFWADPAYVLARRAHRYARILEVIS